ncbi:MAG: H-type small acid-soluble spore protein [Bacillota bacterium]|nr:H-type small acid-soluble spore protein [Bacillota bacterium]
MNRERAKEIMESQGIIQVLYGSSPVWIEDLNGDNAQVSYIGSNNRIQVPLNKLNETHPM